ncbi:MAG: hypothetical protein M1358_23325 [Chloroflexi bacterium]|nr:hypothetical protein [Chloroflexota bacterium]
MTLLIDKLEEYEGLKRDFPDSIVLVQIGAFYKTFGEDASTVAECLGMPVTRAFIGREVKSVSIPFQSIDEYEKRLMAHGHEIVKADMWGVTLSRPAL